MVAEDYWFFEIAEESRLPHELRTVRAVKKDVPFVECVFLYLVVVSRNTP